MTSVELYEKNDVLKLLSKQYLENILEELKKILPTSIRDHHYLYHYLKNYKLIENPVYGKDISVVCKPKFYGPRNCSNNNCTYIAITKEEKTDYWIFLSTQETDGKELIDCLNETKLINWSAVPIYFSCDVNYFDKIYETLKTKTANWIIEDPEGVYYLSKDEIDFLSEPKIPKSYYFKELHLENAKIIDDNWSHKYAGSLKLIETSIKLNGGLGLFNEHDEMITWMVTNELMCPGFLTVIESERRKGYASAITSEEFKRFAKQFDIDICVRVICNNNASTCLMKKLGCRKITEEMWIGRIE